MGIPRVLIPAALFFIPAKAHLQTRLSSSQAEKIVTKVLKSSPVIDGHNDLLVHYFDCRDCPRTLDQYRIDTITTGHTDIPRWRKGKLGGQLLNIFGRDSSMASYMQGWDLLYQMGKKYNRDLQVVGSAKQMRSVMKQGKIAILPTLERAVRIQNGVHLLEKYYALGLRGVTFAYQTNKLADGSDDNPRHNGISDSGRTMVKAMNRLGILIDISHISAKAMNDILDISSAPVIFSHSNARALCDVNRNVDDKTLVRLKQNGGLIMLTAVPDFVKKEFFDWSLEGEKLYNSIADKYRDQPNVIDSIMIIWEKKQPVVTVSDLAGHFDHVKKLIGVEHIGIAGDFDGMNYTIKGLEDVSTYPALLKELAIRGWTRSELKKITSENFLRLFAEVESESRKFVQLP